MQTQTPLLNWRSPEGYRAIMAWYDAQCGQLMLPYQSFFVPTRCGPTHLIVAGEADRPPVFLLHGMSANAMMWRRQLAALARQYRVYALDVIGQSGKSAPSRPWKSGMGYAEWLGDVLDALHVQQACFVGISNGAWLTLKFASRTPERVKKAALLSAAGFLPVSAEALGKLLLLYSGFLLIPSHSSAYRLARFFAAPDVPLLDEVSDLMYIVLRYHKHQSAPPVIRPDDLHAFNAPVLLLMGAYESLFDPRAVIDTAARVLPNLAHAEIVPHAGHTLTYDQPAYVSQQLIDFLA